jgi:hypothetical protein
VFFDGTLNNRFNAVSRARADGGYQNALSNPALLYARYKNRREFDERNACGGAGAPFGLSMLKGRDQRATRRTTPPAMPLAKDEPE